MPKEPSPRVIAGWHEDIRRNGSKRLSLRALLKLFGAERRGRNVEARIVATLGRLSPPLFANGLHWAESIDEAIDLAVEERKQIGRLVELESELMTRFVAEMLPQLPGLRDAVRDYRPDGTRDVFDWLCTDAAGRSVVVELKRDEGERRAVEQVLRYLQHLRRDSQPHRDPRAVLVTGYADRATRLALDELSADDRARIEWWIYGLDGPRLLLERVT